MLDTGANDIDVLGAWPQCPTANDGRPTRRAKIMYLLDLADAPEKSLGSFIEQDIDDVLGLFNVFNSATHGAAGKFDLTS